MKIQTFSIVVGGKKCNAHCPYCVSKMTGDDGLCEEAEEINVRNFHKACEFAKMSGVSTILLTGKGEPLLYPELITQYLEILQYYHFPFIELHTNGMEIDSLPGFLFEKWYKLGLTTISLSCVSWDTLVNKRIYSKKYMGVINYAHRFQNFGFSIRISCIMIKNEVGIKERVTVFAGICEAEGIEQLTVRPVENYSAGESDEISAWVRENRPDERDIADMQYFFDHDVYSHLLLELAHGAKVYDYKGQNISVNTCLTESPNPDDIRQLIFFPDGSLRYSWKYKGAIII